MTASRQGFWKRNRRNRTAAGDGNWESVCYSGNGSLRQKQAAVWTVKDQKCEKLLEDAETIEATKDGVCTFYPAEKTVYDPLVSEWDSAEETVPVYYERTADGFAERSYRELTASEYLAYVSAEDSDEEAQAWKEKLEEQFYTQTDENTEYTYWFYAIGEDKIAYRCREAGQSVGQEEGIDHAVAKYSWCISSLDQGKLTKASETISGDGFSSRRDWSRKKRWRAWRIFQTNLRKTG